MEAQGGQTDKTENGGCADGALQPVAAVSLAGLPDQRQAGIEEYAQAPSAEGQGIGRAWVRFFQKFAEDLGEDARVGNGDGQHPGDRTQTGYLQQQ